MEVFKGLCSCVQEGYSLSHRGRGGRGGGRKKV